MPSSRTRRLLAAAAALALTAAGTAGADHTDPDSVTPVQDGPPSLPVVHMPLLAWTHIAHFVANPGTDLKFFERDGVTYASAGTLGGGGQGHAGQRFIRLVTEDGDVQPEWVGDHGSAACGLNQGTGNLSLQHDTTATPRDQTQLVIDATDATERCHDPEGGGLELIDVVGIGGLPDNDSLREVHLTRHDGYSHTHTVDDKRPWLVYNSNTDGGRPWIDVVDIRTCLGNEADQLETKRQKCRPIVHRIPFEPRWTGRADASGNVPEETSGSGCHDITSRGTRIYCAGISGTAIIDVAGLTVAQGPDIPAPDDPRGDVKGRPLPCTVVDGTDTTAKVTNCDLGAGNDSAGDDREAYDAAGRPAAVGWVYGGSVNHGPSSTSPREDIAISHEADPTPDHRWMFVTDERGGGVSPPGASCATGIDNPQGNGGVHVFDISDPTQPKYATTADGAKAIFISTNLTPMVTFCTVHVIEQVPDEQRIFMAWYNQGIKVVDYDIAEDGTWSFEEVAYYNTPGNANWVAEPFRIEDNGDGTRTYFVMTSDIARGIDVVSVTLEANPLEDHTTTTPPPINRKPTPNPAPTGGGDPAPKPTGPTTRPRGPLAATGVDYGLLGVGGAAVVAALALRRRRQRSVGEVA